MPFGTNERRAILAIDDYGIDIKFPKQVSMVIQFLYKKVILYSPTVTLWKGYCLVIGAPTMYTLLPRPPLREPWFVTMLLDLSGSWSFLTATQGDTMTVVILTTLSWACPLP